MCPRERFLISSSHLVQCCNVMQNIRPTSTLYVMHCFSFMVYKLALSLGEPTYVCNGLYNSEHKFKLPLSTPWRYIGGMGGKLQSLLTLVLVGGEWSTSRPGKELRCPLNRTFNGHHSRDSNLGPSSPWPTLCWIYEASEIDISCFCECGL